MKLKFLKKNLGVSIILCLMVNVFFLNTVFATQTTNEIDKSLTQEENKTEVKSEVVPLNTDDSILDIKAKDNIYRFSEDEKDIYLPYIRYSSDRIIMDKEIAKIGAVFSAKSIEVDSPIQKSQVLIASDSIRLNAKMEQPIIFTGNDVVIDSEITGSAIIFSSNNITITENGKIGEDVICFSNKLIMKGQIDGSLIGFFSEGVDISGTIKKDLRINTSQINISGNENIRGNLLIQTYNENLNIKNNYPNAIIKVLEEKTNTFNKINIVNIILKGITNCLVFTLIYILLCKYLKNNKAGKSLEKIKKHFTFTMMSGAIILLSSPMIFVFLILLMIIGLGILGIPLFISYFGFIVVFSILSTFVVGSFSYSYIKEKYLKNNNLGYDIIGAFVSFMTLYILSNLPYIGAFVSILLVMISNGIIFTLIFKKSKEITKSKE
jgi:hypothetical protein